MGGQLGLGWQPLAGLVVACADAARQQLGQPQNKGNDLAGVN